MVSRHHKLLDRKKAVRILNLIPSYQIPCSSDCIKKARSEQTEFSLAASFNELQWQLANVFSRAKQMHLSVICIRADNNDVKTPFRP